MILLVILMLQFKFKQDVKIESINLKSQIPKVSYDSSKNYVSKVKSNLKRAFEQKTIDIDSVSKTMTNLLLESIIPYWYGTAWDFNGYTAKPKQGVIACGYFVSTTMLHAGFNLNRYKMAQKASMEEALCLEPKDSLFIRYTSRDKFVKEFSSNAKDGIYLVGLSFHVGYLYKSASELFFIHSNYINHQGVIKEKAIESQALEASDVFVVADITNNEILVKKWLNEDEIK